MRIAYCLYGQPRDYKKGYETINSFISKQKNLIIDFFYHTWLIEPDDIYNVSPWRDIDSKTLVYQENVIDNLKKLYQPISSHTEKAIKKFDTTLYENTLAFKNTHNSKKLANIDNILSQMYSRTKVRNLLNEYIATTGTNYQCVIMSRFDYNKDVTINLNNIDLSKVHVSYQCYPRAIIPDNFIISPTDVFLDWFNIFDNLTTLLNDQYIFDLMQLHKENLEINSEELILANYLFYNNDVKNIEYSYQIPCFS